MEELYCKYLIYLLSFIYSMEELYCKYLIYLLSFIYSMEELYCKYLIQFVLLKLPISISTVYHLSRRNVIRKLIIKL